MRYHRIVFNLVRLHIAISMYSNSEGLKLPVC